jgi:uncharacterized protein
MPTREQTLDIVVGNAHIDGTLITPDARMPGVLFLHGWGGSQTQYCARAKQIAALGCVCLTVDLRGHAKTQREQASVTREDNLADALAAYDVLAGERTVDRSAIAVVGSSYGGYLGALLSRQRPVKWLALRAPALYKDSDWNVPKLSLRQVQDLEAYRRQEVHPNENRALAACAAFEGDVLIVESGKDLIVPHQVIENYRKAFTKARSLTYRAIDGADHGLTHPSCREAYTALLVNWITEMVAGARVPTDASVQKRMQDATPLVLRNCGADKGEQQACVDRMAHVPIRSIANQRVVLFQSNRCAPIAGKVDARPDAERETQRGEQGSEREQADTVRDDLPVECRNPRVRCGEEIGGDQQRQDVGGARGETLLAPRRLGATGGYPPVDQPGDPHAGNEPSECHGWSRVSSLIIGSRQCAEATDIAARTIAVPGAWRRAWNELFPSGCNNIENPRDNRILQATRYSESIVVRWGRNSLSRLPEVAPT